MMRVSYEPMSSTQFKRYVDRGLIRVERSKAGKKEFAALKAKVRALSRTVGAFGRLHGDFALLRIEVRQSALETRRHFDVVAESLRDDIRLLAEAVAGHSWQLDNHETPLTHLEQRP